MILVTRVKKQQGNCLIETFNNAKRLSVAKKEFQKENIQISKHRLICKTQNTDCIN